jgi:hypothetical protein
MTKQTCFAVSEQLLWLAEPSRSARRENDYADADG